MADLCDELLNSHTPTDSLTGLILALVGVVCTFVGDPFEQYIPSERVIRCLRKATTRPSDSHDISITLAASLLKRFDTRWSSDDCKEAMAVLDDVINSRNPGGRPNPRQKLALELAAVFATSRYVTHSKPEDLEQVFSRTRARLDGISFDDPDRAAIIEDLSHLHRMRFSSDSRITDIARFGASESMTISLAESNHADLLPRAVVRNYLEAFQPSAINRLTDMVDIEECVKYCQQLLAFYPFGSDHAIAPLVRSTLCNLFRRAFKCTNQRNQPEYRNKAVSAARDYVSTADTMVMHVVNDVDSVLKLIKCPFR